MAGKTVYSVVYLTIKKDKAISMLHDWFEAGWLAVLEVSVAAQVYKLPSCTLQKGTNFWWIKIVLTWEEKANLNSETKCWYVLVEKRNKVMYLFKKEIRTRSHSNTEGALQQYDLHQKQKQWKNLEAEAAIDPLRPCLDLVGFASIHIGWGGLKWNLTKFPLQSTPTHPPTHVDWGESDNIQNIQTRPKVDIHMQSVMLR